MATTTKTRPKASKASKAKASKAKPSKAKCAACCALKGLLHPVAVNPSSESTLPSRAKVGDVAAKAVGMFLAWSYFRLAA